MANERVNSEYMKDAVKYIVNEPNQSWFGSNPFFGPDLAISAWNGFPAHHSNFGFGNPVYIGLPPIPADGLVHVLPTVDNNNNNNNTGPAGARVSVALMSHQMEKLRSDPLLIQYLNWVSECINWQITEF